MDCGFEPAGATVSFSEAPACRDGSVDDLDCFAAVADLLGFLAIGKGGPLVGNGGYLLTVKELLLPQDLMLLRLKIYRIRYRKHWKSDTVIQNEILSTRPKGLAGDARGDDTLLTFV